MNESIVRASVFSVFTKTNIHSKLFSLKKAIFPLAIPLSHYNDMQKKKHVTCYKAESSSAGLPPCSFNFRLIGGSSCTSRPNFYIGGKE